MWIDFDFGSFASFYRDQVLYYTKLIIWLKEAEERAQRWRRKIKFFVLAHAAQVERVESAGQNATRRRANSMPALKRIVPPIVIVITLIIRF